MKQKQRRNRQLAVQRYLKGEGLSAIARSMGYSRRWVYKWVARYQATEAAAEWYEEQSRCPHSNSASAFCGDSRSRQAGPTASL